MDKYEYICQIGKGNFGSISKIIRKEDKKILIWKELVYGQLSEKEKQQIVSEVNILRGLNHPNIVRYYDRIIDKKNSKIYIIMEYCEGGDLGKLIKKCKKTKEYISEDIIWKIFTQVVLALLVCHNKKDGKIIHRDIKPSNIFLDADNNVKLGDFGLSRVLSNESNFAYSHVGTPYYMSPEQIDEGKYNEKCDIWSLGCFLYEITTFNPPFEAKNQVMLAMRIKSGKVEKINSNYSEELWRVISWMLNVNPENRPSAEDLLNIPQVNIRLREKNIKENLVKIKIKEDNLNKKEEELKIKEKELEKKEKELKEKEELLNEREKNINELSKKMSSVSTNYTNSNSANNNNNTINHNSHLGMFISYGNNNIKSNNTTEEIDKNVNGKTSFNKISNISKDNENSGYLYTNINHSNSTIPYCHTYNSEREEISRASTPSKVYSKANTNRTQSKDKQLNTSLNYRQKRNYDFIPNAHSTNSKRKENSNIFTNNNKSQGNFKFDPNIYIDNNNLLSTINRTPSNVNLISTSSSLLQKLRNNNNILSESKGKNSLTKRAGTSKYETNNNLNYASVSPKSTALYNENIIHTRHNTNYINKINSPQRVGNTPRQNFSNYININQKSIIPISSIYKRNIPNNNSEIEPSKTVVKKNKNLLIPNKSLMNEIEYIYKLN